MTYNVYQDKDDKIKIYEEIIDDFSDIIKQKADPIMWMCQSILKLTKREKKPSEFLRNGLILILEHYHNYKVYISLNESTDIKNLPQTNKRFFISTLKQEIIHKN